MSHVQRAADYPVHDIFLQRWSPRAFSESTISPDELFSLLEAARWAPSAFNAQPWRFIYARRGAPGWGETLALLSDYNRSWAQAAAALVFIASHKLVTTSKGVEPSRTHSFDAGAAWAHLALQASLTDWHAHGIAGFDEGRARQVLNVPDDFHLEAVVAIGRRGDTGALPERLQAREKPSSRHPLSALAFEGAFPLAATQEATAL